VADLQTPQGKRRSVFGLGRLVLLGLGLLLVAAALVVWLRPRPSAAPEAKYVDEELEQALAVVNPGYVGIEVCAECHDKRAALVKTTRHYLACRAAPEGVAAPGFSAGRGHLPTRVPGTYYEMTGSKCDGFTITQVKGTAQGEERRRFQAGLVYGSGGKFDETYFAWQDDGLYHPPVSWLYPLQRWGSHDVESNRVDPVAPACLECHNTWMAHVPGTPNRFRRNDMVLGVTCERCHGPGREHVEHHRARPNDQVARAILHPGTLSRERLMDVCAQCHTFNRTIGRAFSYRPGEPLEAFANIPKSANPEIDSTNPVRYLRQSKCFQKSEMTCITCHDPHRLQSAKDACSKCHVAASCTEQPRLPAAVRGDCVGCHMPTRIRMHFHYYTTADDRYVPMAIRAEHQIGVYPEAKQTRLLAWRRTQADPHSRAEADRLAAQLTSYWLAEAERRLRAHRYEGAAGALREALQIGPDPVARKRLDEIISQRTKLDDLNLELNRADRLDKAAALLRQMLVLRPRNAYLHRAMGSVLAAAGRHDEAGSHLRKVAKYDPSDASGVISLARMAYREGRTEDAADLCVEAHEIDPSDRTNYSLWGMVLMRLGRWEDAEKQFRKALHVNPTDTDANRGLGELLHLQGKAEEALRFDRRAIQWKNVAGP
jgi:tetratricopeptide (TPR) repeat protein